jgi:hypothetical protein
MRRAALLLALLVSGCGALNTRQTTYWRATLDRVPDTACIAQATVQGVHVGSPRDGTTKQLFHKPTEFHSYPVSVDGYVFQPIMWVAITRPDKGPVTFVLSYGYAVPKMDDQARALIHEIALHCGMPELETRLRLDRESSWEPYFANI